MAVYRYSGFSNEGKSVSGLVDAPNEKGAMDRLGGDGIVPVSLAAEASGDAAGERGPKTGKRPSGRISMNARTQFIRELATFVNADIPLLEALDVLRSQEHNPAFKSVLDEIHNHVQGGESFSKALVRFPKLFPPLLVSMVKVGETGGLLGQVLEQIAVWMERDEVVRGEIRGALAYPSIILLLGLICIFVIFSFVLPRITKIFEGAGAALPLPTRILMVVAGFMSQRWWLVLLLLVGGVFLVRWMMTKREVKNAWDKAVLHIPILGTMVQQASIARFSRACGALLANGVPLLEALRVVRELISNVVMADVIDQTVERVTRGASLSKTLGESRWFPQGVVHLLGVGERTGRLGDMFERVATTFENKTRSQIKILLDILAPLLILCLALLVGAIAIAILLPIMTMSSIMK